MTRTQPLFYRRRILLWIAAALLALGGGLAVAFLQIDRAEGRATELASEADRRGDAVSTLAGDVRTLRAQIRAGGETPAVPDLADAVDDLPARAEVPVPIPGPPGPTGARGERVPAGKDGAAATPSPGPAGADGRAGADSTVPGPAGPQGPAGPPGAAGKDGTNGKDGVDGRDGTPGPSYPDGYSLQPPPGDPDGLMCRRDGAPPPEPPAGSPSPLALALDPTRRQYPCHDAVQAVRHGGGLLVVERARDFRELAEDGFPSEAAAVLVVPLAEGAGGGLQFLHFAYTETPWCPGYGGRQR